MRLSEGVLRYLAVGLDEETKEAPQLRQKDIPQESRKSTEEDGAKLEPQS
mgnify:CR=1 FL=1